jgi:hypothetical protein
MVTLVHLDVKNSLDWNERRQSAGRQIIGCVMYWVSSAVAARKRDLEDNLLLVAILILGAWVRLSALDLGGIS